MSDTPTPSSNSGIIFDNIIGKGIGKKIVGGFLSGEDSGQERAKVWFQEKFPGAEVLRAKQVHGKDIAFLTSPESVTTFLSKPHEERLYDGLITDQADKVLVIRTADCIPILFYGGESALIGALHCGWRPLAAGIITQAFSHLSPTPGLKLEGLRFHIGPAICQRCYEVGEEVVAHFEKSVPDLSSVIISHAPKKFLLDLKGLSRLLLIEEGASDSAITIDPTCTRCHPDFFSHRENQTPERNLNFIAII